MESIGKSVVSVFTFSFMSGKLHLTRGIEVQISVKNTGPVLQQGWLHYSQSHELCWPDQLQRQPLYPLGMRRSVVQHYCRSFHRLTGSPTVIIQEA